MNQLPSPVWLHSLQYCSASELVQLLRCDRYQHDTLLADRTAEQLLRRYFLLTKQQLANANASSTLHRLLIAKASLEKQLQGQALPALHNALLTQAICAFNPVGCAPPHSQTRPMPNDLSQSTTTHWVHGPASTGWDECTLSAEPNLTLASIGLRNVRLWYGRPFWQCGWAEYVRSWVKQPDSAFATYPTLSLGEQLVLKERDAICEQLDARVRWLGCVQTEPTSVRAFGFFHGRVARRSHWVPATFGSPGLHMQLAHSRSADADCQRAKAEGRSVDGAASDELPIVTFDLSGSRDTVNGHHLRLYDSLGVFLLSQAAGEGAQCEQQVRHFLQQHDAGGGRRRAAHDALVMEHEQCVTSEQLRGLPLYLGCFPICARMSSLWDSGNIWEDASH